MLPGRLESQSKQIGSDTLEEKTWVAYLKKYVKIFLNMGISIAGIVLVVWLGPKFLGFFMPFVIGWLIALIANPLVRFLEKRLKIVRKHSSAVIVIGVLAGIILGGYFIISKLVIECIRFARDLPELYYSAEAEIRLVMEHLSRLFQFLPQKTQTALSQLGNNLSEYMGTLIQSIGMPTVEAAGNVAKNIPNVLIQIIVTILSSYFFIADRDRLMERLHGIIPKSVSRSIDMISNHFKTVVGGYFKAQFRIMGIVAVILFIGFLILDVDYAVLLACLIAFLDFLPFFGTGTALIPWALVKLFAAEYETAVGLIIIYLVSQLVRQVIQPKIVGDSMGLNPLQTLMFMFIGFKFYGVAGMILAVPIGLILLKLYEAGVFDDIINGVKEIVKDINTFRRS